MSRSRPRTLRLKQKVKAEEAAKAAEYEAIAKRDKRRDELVKELTENPSTAYQYASPLSQQAIDRIIELEAAQA